MVNPATSQFHKDQILTWFMYHLPMDQRQRLMRDLPAAYNDICGVEIVRVVMVDTIPSQVGKEICGL